MLQLKQGSIYKDFLVFATDRFLNFHEFYKKLKLKPKISDNLEKRICRHFHISSQFSLTTSEEELDYYHQKMNVQVASWATKD